MNGDQAVISVQGLETRFGAQIIHHDLDIEIYRGEVIGIVGGSGTGKSVLLRTMIGLNRQTAGTVKLFGATLDEGGDEAGDDAGDGGRKALETRCGVLFQDGALFSSLTVAQNVAVPLKEHTDLAPELIAKVAALKISMVGLPPEAGGKFPSELSGGMRKRAGLARALALDPEILFLDEPTAGLDPIAAAGFDSLIGDLRNTLDLTVVMVTHDLDSLIAICDRIAVLIDGNLVIGTIDSLVQEAHPWIHDYFHGPRARAALVDRI